MRKKAKTKKTYEELLGGRWSAALYVGDQRFVPVRQE